MNRNIQFKNVKLDDHAIVITDELRSELNFFDKEYFDFISIYNAAEGWFGEEYIKFWNANDIIRLNLEYKISDYIPKICIFASDRCGSAFAINKENKKILKLPFIPFDINYIEKTYESISHFIDWIEESEKSTNEKNRINSDTFNKEVFEKHPIVLGGDPKDISNKVFLTDKQHIEAVVFFNKIVKEVKGKSA